MTTAKSEYERLSRIREPFLRRARDAARLTIPALIPPEGHTGHSDLPTPYQGLGAEGVNNLAAKLQLGMLPPNEPFFQLVLPESEELVALGEDVQIEVEAELQRTESTIQEDLNVANIRPTTFEGFKHLLVAGNVTLYIPRSGGSRLYALDEYVADRDGMGELQQLIIREMVSPYTLPEEAQEIGVNREDHRSDDGLGERDDVELFTWVKRTGKASWSVHQEFRGVPLPSTIGTYKGDDFPYLVLRLTEVSGEDYGRGRVEEFIGDILSLEGLSKALVEGAAGAARLLGLVDPTSSVNADDLNRAPNGSFVRGREGEVSFLRLDKGADFQFALIQLDRIERRLSRAFLLNTAVQRDAERVTAQEIRIVARELEQALGGVFTSLSTEFQRPLVKLLMRRARRRGAIPEMPNSVQLAIVTGLETLGRAAKLEKLNLFAETAAIVTEGRSGQYINVPNTVAEIATAAGIDPKKHVLTEEQVAEAQQNELTQQMIQKLGPAGIGALKDQLPEMLGLASGGDGSAPPQPPQQ